MNTEPYKQLAIMILGWIAGYFVSKGYFNQATANELIGAATTLGAGVWAIWRSRVPVMVANTDAAPGVKGVVTTPEIAKQVPSPTVVAPSAAATLNK